MFFRFHCEFVTLIVHFTKHQNFFGIEVVNFYFLKDCSDLFPLLRTGNKCFLKRKKKKTLVSTLVKMGILKICISIHYNFTTTAFHE